MRLSAAVLCLVPSLATVSGCGGSEDGTARTLPTLRFDAVVGGGLEPAFALAWNRAAANHAGGFDYSMTVHTTGLKAGTPVDLIVARDLQLFANGVPVTGGDYKASTRAVGADGVVTFPPLAVVDPCCSEDAIYAPMLCGSTLVIARARQDSQTVLASTWFLVATPPARSQGTPSRPGLMGRLVPELLPKPRAAKGDPDDDLSSRRSSPGRTQVTNSRSTPTAA